MTVVTGDCVRPFPMDLRASWKGSIEDGCAMLGSVGSFFTSGKGAFLNVGNLGLGFGAEKKDESDLASFTGGPVVADLVVVEVGFAVPTAAFLAGGAFAGSLDLRFLAAAAG